MTKKPHARSCLNCRHLSSEDDGNFAEYVVSWPCCGIVERFQYLKSFPFKKRMPCFKNNLIVDDYKLYNPNNKLYCGGVWVESDFDRLIDLESRNEIYR